MDQLADTEYFTFTDGTVCRTCNRTFFANYTYWRMPWHFYDTRLNSHIRRCKINLEIRIADARRNSHFFKRPMAAPPVPAGPAMCTNCKPPIPFGDPKVAGPTSKNPGKVYYSCQQCDAFCWYDDYGKPKKQWGNKRKEAPSAEGEDNNNAWRLRMESKFDEQKKTLDEVFAYLKSFQV